MILPDLDILISERYDSEISVLLIFFNDDVPWEVEWHQVFQILIFPCGSYLF